MFWGDFWVILGVPMGGILDFRGQKLQNCKILQNNVSNVILQYFTVLQFMTPKIQDPAHAQWAHREKNPLETPEN